MDIFSGFATLPAYGLAAVAIMVLYAIQSELRFGSRARSHRAGAADRMSTIFVSAAAVVPIAGLIFAMKAKWPWFVAAAMPGLPWSAWIGVASGAIGLALRLWAVLVLRERFTRTLLVHDGHTVERGGPYRWVRHPGYLGSLLSLNGIALASGNALVFLASLLATCAAYNYRVRVEDEMLVAALGEAYARYRREVPAIFPLRRN